MHWNQATFLTGDGIKYPRKGLYKNQSSWQKVKNMNHFVFLSFYFGARNDNSLVVRRVSPGGIIVVLFWTKCAVPRQNKPGILKLNTSRGQRNLSTVFIFVSCEEKGWYRIVSLGHQKFWLPITILRAQPPYARLEFGRHVARIRRRRCRPLVYVPTSNTAIHDNHEKINLWVSFSFQYEYVAPLGRSSGRRIAEYFDELCRTVWLAQGTAVASNRPTEALALASVISFTFVTINTLNT